LWFGRYDKVIVHRVHVMNVETTPSEAAADAQTKFSSYGWVTCFAPENKKLISR